MLSRNHLLPAIIVGSIAFALYLATLPADYTWAYASADSGDLIAAAVTGGIPHPPGYPLYMLLGRVVAALPFGTTLAWRFHLLSAAAIAVAAGLVTMLPLGASQRPVATGVIGLTFATLPFIWQQALVTEVYAVNVALIGFTLLAIRKRAPTILVGVLWGLAIVSHLTALLLLPLILIQLRTRRWVNVGLGVLLGLSPFALLPLWAASSSPVVWGDPVTLNGWWWVISGQLYQPNVGTASRMVIATRLWEWWPYAISLIIIAIAGLQAQPNVDRLANVGTAALYIGYSFTYRAVDANVILTPAYLLLMPLMLDAIPTSRQIILIPLLTSIWGISTLLLSPSTYQPVRQYVQQILPQAPTEAILITDGTDQTTFALWYFHYAEEMRPDLIIVDPHLFAFPWYRQRLHQQASLPGLQEDNLPVFIELNQATRSICHASLVEPAISCIMKEP